MMTPRLCATVAAFCAAAAVAGAKPARLGQVSVPETADELACHALEVGDLGRDDEDAFPFETPQ